MKLFEEYPEIGNDVLLLRKMRMEDAPALQALAEDLEVYRMLPTFLYEQKYADKREVIARMDEECFRTKDSILLAVCRAETPEEMIGIAEIYGYEADREKVSIGCRLSSSCWGQGIATQVIRLLKAYLLEETEIRTITAHILPDNHASAAAAEKNGFRKLYADVPEDWGFAELTRTDKYVFKRRWLSETA